MHAFLWPCTFQLLYCSPLCKVHSFLFLLPHNFLFLPPSFLFLSVSSSRSGGHLDVGTTRIIVNSSGHHQWYSPINFESHCKIDVRNFPFDQQACVVKLGSWTYDGTRLDIIPEASTADLGKTIGCMKYYDKNLGRPKNATADFYRANY